MKQEILEKNISILKLINPLLSEQIINAKSSNDYNKVEAISKTEIRLPVFNNGKLLYSKYNPKKEIERLFSGKEEFVLFSGIASGLHINYFLKTYTNKYCVITDIDFSNLKILFSKFDFTEVLKNNRCTLLPPFSEKNFVQELIKIYKPIIHGNFSVKALRPWENFYQDKIPIISKKIKIAINQITADLSTQSHFGKIWMRNIFLNLKTASKIKPEYPRINKDKIAYILGAGPSLEKDINYIKQNRERFILFATDTAFSVLNQANIKSDFFISIDPQIISYHHCYKPFNKACIGIFDICSNPLVVREFLKNGNNIFFGAGTHPMTQLASNFSSFPTLITNAGTVAITAKFIAKSLGFSKIEYSGLDFAYTNGKAYSKGTYLSNIYNSNSNKISGQETKFIELMFRTPIITTTNNGKLTYQTNLLNSYKNFFLKNEYNIIWDNNDFTQFKYNEFIKYLHYLAKNKNQILQTCFLPYFAYQSKKKHKNYKNYFDLELVLSEFSEYTVQQ